MMGITASSPQEYAQSVQGMAELHAVNNLPKIGEKHGSHQGMSAGDVTHQVLDGAGIFGSTAGTSSGISFLA